jgi:HAD superfamily hydrolase (TIGR01509 family)
MLEPSNQHFAKIKPSGILWDMDGVLVDTADAHYQSWVDALAPYKVEYDRKLFNTTFGMNNQSIVHSILGDDFPDDELLKISDEKEYAFRAAVKGRVVVLPGVRTWLERFAAYRVPQAVASSAPMANIDAVVDETGIRPYFNAIISAFGQTGKPDPWVFIEAGRQLGANPKTGIVIEDSPAGVLGAHRAGYLCIAVSSSLSLAESKTANLLVNRLDQVKYEDIERILPN